MVDPTYSLRFLHLLQRIEARVCGQESGEFTSLFAGVDDVASDPKAAIAKLEAAYPQVAEIHVTPADAAWFPVLVSEYPKPMPFVPVIDNACCAGGARISCGSPRTPAIPPIPCA